MASRWWHRCRVVPVVDSLTHAVTGACVATATAQYAMPEYMAVATATGFIAGLLPDLDYLFVLAKKPLLAWKYHRVALHNIFVVPLLAVFAVALTYLFLALVAALGLPELVAPPIFGTQVTWLYCIAVLALASHLVLDYITSFGSAFLYPLSTQRFALGSHFLTDPLVLLIAGVGCFFDVALSALAVLFFYLLLAVVFKRWAFRRAMMVWEGIAGKQASPKLFPRPGAPWRWLAVVDTPQNYAVFYVTPTSSSTVNWVDKGLTTDSRGLYHTDPLLAHFVAMSACPRFEDTQRDGKPAVVVEDVQWWWALPTRPMAFSAIVDGKKLIDLRETRKFDKGPTGEPEPVPFIKKPV